VTAREHQTLSMKPSTLSKLRRLSQIVFLAAFLLLLFETEFGGAFLGAGAPGRPYTVSIFLLADPLTAVVTALSTWTLYRGLLWCLIILVPTFVLGRFFCGWICPLGSLNHFVSALKSEKKRGMRLIESNRYKPWQALKYYVLGTGLVAALFGSVSLGLIDPIALTVRSLAVSFIPSLGYAIDGTLDAGYRTGVQPLRLVIDGIDVLLQRSVLSFQQPHFRQSFLLGLVFLAILVVNLRVTRLWCRALCPLGAMLGLASRWSILGLEKRSAQCDDCNRCLLHCQGGDDPSPGVQWRKAECHLCLNCVGDCPTAGVAFTFFPGRSTTVEAPELKRRKLLTGLAAGAGLVPLLRSTTGFAVEADPHLIRPPGALDEPDFLARCIRCGQCMKVCPNNALHPALTEGGLEGLWTPVLVPRVGYCEPNCVLCGEVCPTGAIWELTVAEKLGGSGVTAVADAYARTGQAAPQGQNPNADTEMAGTPVKIGTAFYDRGRCLPWAMATECIVCEEWCPTSPKAITLQPVDVIDSQGAVVKVRQPSVDPKRCIGCGACEYACPVRDRPAVYVTSVGETRSRTNQFILQRVPNRS
jgi:polyferredoxin